MSQSPVPSDSSLEVLPSDGGLEVSMSGDDGFEHWRWQALALDGQNYIDRLPVELLSTILVFVLDPDEWDDDDGAEDLPEPFILQSVCRRWRNVCLTVPELWDGVLERTYATSKWTELALDRTRGRPLNFQDLIVPSESSEGNPVGWMRIFPLIRDRALLMGRARTLNVAQTGPVSPHVDQPDWASLVRSIPPTELKKFVLTLHEAGLESEVIFDDKAFTGTIPLKMRSFRVMGVRILLSSLVWRAPQMTHVDLAHCRFECTIPALLRVIGEMTCLSSLGLSLDSHHGLALTDEGNPESLPAPVDIMQLRFLKLSMELAYAEAIYDNVVLSDQCYLFGVITIHGDVGLEAAIAALDRMYADRLLSAFPVDDVTHAREVSIWYSLSRPWSLTMGLSRRSIIARDVKERVLQIVPKSYWYELSIMKAVCLHMLRKWAAFTPSTVLAVGPLPLGIWAEVLAALPSIITIKVTGSLSDLPDVLVRTHAAAYPRSLNCVVLRSMECIGPAVDKLSRGLARPYGQGCGNPPGERLLEFEWCTSSGIRQLYKKEVIRCERLAGEVSTVTN
ncbi:unnamed protein product [Peniophora sp. CBMAI 1063]|nr:unnamed protein product [Peniophora sp. CBMAI 1063]